MPTRASASPAPTLAKRDLETCIDVPSIFSLFHKLRYPVEALPVAVPLNDGDLPGGLRDGIVARYPIARIGGMRPGDPLVSVTFFELKDRRRRSELIRGITQVWTRRFSGEHLYESSRIFEEPFKPERGRNP